MFLNPKLEKLAADEGLTVDELMNRSFFDTVPGICTRPQCDFTVPDIEPDQRQGWCDLCEATTVASALVLAGVL